MGPRAGDAARGAVRVVWCSGPILEAVQQARIFADCKDFVDSPLLVEPAECWRRWDALPKPVSPAALRQFVRATFGDPGGELVAWHPPDHKDEPDLVKRLPEGPSRDWARILNAMWPQLGRQVSASVRDNPLRSTLLPVPHPLIVPGGRFREGYYWDSYWIVLGLLSVGMRATARGMVENLLHCVSTYGFVPNGLRTYYLNRSQPPLLTQMVAAVARHSTPQQEEELLQHALPLLEAEYAWWMRGGESGSCVTLVDPDEPYGSARLNRYVVRAPGPRPESWREDVATAAKVPAAEREGVYGELAAAAESGWDFSSRWLATRQQQAGADLAALRTSSLLAVDLNAILLRNERSISRMLDQRAEMFEAAHKAFALAAETADASAKASAVDAAARSVAARSLVAEAESALGAKAAAAALRARAEYYAGAAAARERAMRKFMWDERQGLWLDVDWRAVHRVPQPSLASFFPLWAGSASAAEAEAAVRALCRLKLVAAGGAATTGCDSGQQWDWPNAWPPLQQMLIEGLEAHGGEEGRALAKKLAHSWLAANWKGWARTGVMHEKYDATQPGERGAGGEYEPQIGFGWTNGVVLWLLQHYGESWCV